MLTAVKIKLHDKLGTRKMARKKTTAPKAFCFVLMPFEDGFNDVYQLGIKEACTKAGAYCERVDEQIFHESILDRIYNQIAKADLIIADMTGRNANVFYEVGYAHALGKRTVLLTQDADDIPFDLKHFPHIVYNAGITALRDDLTARVEWCVQNPPDTVESTTIDIELFLERMPLASGDVVCPYRMGNILELEITVHNGSPETFEPGTFKIGVITGDEFDNCDANSIQAIRTTALPKGGFLHMLPDFPKLLPQDYASCGFWLSPARKATTPGNEHQITFRVFTSMGTRDFPLALRKPE